MRPPLQRLRLAVAALAAALAPGGCRGPASMEDLEAWIRREFPEVPQMSVGELQRRLAGEGGERPVLLDGRAAEEFAVSHLEGAIHAPGLETALEVLGGQPKDRLVVVYCSVGYRSSALAEELRQAGFRRAYNLEGSIFEWANRGLPVVRDGEVVRQVHPYNRLWGRFLDPRLHPR